MLYQPDHLPLVSLTRTQKATSLAGRTTVVAYWRILPGFCRALAAGRFAWLEYSIHLIEFAPPSVSAEALRLSVVTLVWKLNLRPTFVSRLGALVARTVQLAVAIVLVLPASSVC